MNSLALLERRGVRQFVKFCFVGVTNTVWDFGVYYVLTRGLLGFVLPYIWANVISFAVSVVNSYVLNRRWTFRSTDDRLHVQFGKFLSVNLVSLGAYELLLFLFVDRLGFFDLVGKGMAVVAVLAWGFLANKFWTFRTGSADLRNH